MRLDSTKVKINSELLKLQRLISEVIPVIETLKQREPNHIEMGYLSTTLQSFYCGIERVVLIYLKSIGDRIPNEGHWHKSILEMMFGSNSQNREIIRNDLKKRILIHLDIRHYVRHAYGFELLWSDIREIVLNLEDTWSKVKEDIEKLTE